MMLQGDLELAEWLLEEVLKRRKKELGEGHMLAVATMNNLANVYQSWGKEDKAIGMYKDARAALELRYGPRNEHLAAMLNNMAILFRRKNQIK